MSKHIISLLSIAALALCVVGCGDGLSSLKGTVTIDGQPAPAGVSLEFQPTDPNGLPSYAVTDASGAYEAAFTHKKKGIQPGETIVRLAPSEIEEPMPVIGPDGKPVKSDKPKNPLANLPGDYYKQIETFTVNPGSNTKDIELKSK